MKAAKRYLLLLLAPPLVLLTICTGPVFSSQGDEQIYTVQHQSKYQSVNVEIYITSWCPYCKKAIEFFNSKGITPVIYDIEKDPKARKKKNQLDSKQGVPFAIINGTPVHGFSESYYQMILDQEF